jgi:hypothetical protein
MPVSVEKMQEIEHKAPHLVSMVKQIGESLENMGIDPMTFLAAVVAAVDHSGSTNQFGLYSDFDHNHKSTMDRVLDLAFAAGLNFDDDGEVPVWLFDTAVYELDDMNLGNCQNYLRVHRNYSFGGTSYLAPLRAIVEKAGFGHVNLGSLNGYAAPVSAPKRGLFGRHKAPSTHVGQAQSSGLSVKATAAYPTYGIIITDGDPQSDRKQDIRDYMTLISQLPIFIQFIGVGPDNFAFLSELDEMEGRFVDNANFFDSKDAGGDQVKMLELMMGEFPSYYRKASKLGLITG